MTTVYDIKVDTDEGGFFILYRYKNLGQDRSFSLRGGYDGVVNGQYIPVNYANTLRRPPFSDILVQVDMTEPKLHFGVEVVNMSFEVRPGNNFFEADFWDFNLAVFNKDEFKFIWSI